MSILSDRRDTSESDSEAPQHEKPCFNSAMKEHTFRDTQPKPHSPQVVCPHGFVMYAATLGVKHEPLGPCRVGQRTGDHNNYGRDVRAFRHIRMKARTLDTLSLLRIPPVCRTGFLRGHPFPFLWKGPDVRTALMMRSWMAQIHRGHRYALQRL